MSYEPTKNDSILANFSKVAGVVTLFCCILFCASTNLAFAALTTRLIANSLDRPVAITHAGDHSNRLFIIQQSGKVITHNGLRTLPTPFLDLGTLISCCGERGLLSVAFHPGYAQNKFFFVDYTDKSGNTAIARFRTSANPNIADKNSRRVILSIPQPFDNHNGGQLQFGRDGYLYISMGDGGAGGDPGNRAQNLRSLLGKILRIDVNHGLPYTIPRTNPFIRNVNARKEIWAYGLRNPWRFSFDRATGQLFIADVGQEQWEEINLQPAASKGGENYGWRLMEGNHCFNPRTQCVGTRILKRPIIEYNHNNGDCSVTGGYRYRGKAIPALYNAYVYGDFCTGRIWRANLIRNRWVVRLLADTNFRISAFGENEAGELYFADYANGSVYKITGI